MEGKLCRTLNAHEVVLDGRVAGDLVRRIGGLPTAIRTWLQGNREQKREIARFPCLAWRYDTTTGRQDEEYVAASFPACW
jgi:hypothetical protein